MEEELDIEQQKIKLKEQIETLKLQLELIARRSGKKENDINKKFEISNFKDGFLVIQKGKKQFKRIIIKGN